ncbi:putative thiamine transporter SLC35F3 isoform X2 [Hemicordylus capensis]|nr:putative thiamine transporter SLC35F3 isoform X2 [Hemicordylus capensis]XP_053155287.1 putative thiamine transporter SLC35F3 isoform X2 [Hemicordylus capensis]
MRRSPDVSPRRLSDISPQLRQLKYLVVDEAIKEDLKWSRSMEDLTSVGLTSIEERILRITGYYGYQPWAASYKRDERSNDSPAPADSQAQAGMEAGGRGSQCCWTCSVTQLKKFFWGVVVVLGVCFSWSGSTQLAKLTFKKFDAPFTLTWFATNWNFLFFPLYYIGHVLKSAEKQSPQQRYRECCQFFGDNGLTLKAFFTKAAPFGVLWTLTNYLYLHAIKKINTTDVSVLFCCNKAFVFLLSWIVLRDRFMGVRIVAAILAIAGIVMMTYADGFHSHSVIGIALVVGSASMSALYKVQNGNAELCLFVQQDTQMKEFNTVHFFYSQALFKLLLGSAKFGEAALFLSVLAVFNILFVTFIPVILYFTKVEYWSSFDAIPWGSICGFSVLLLTFNILLNFGIAITYPTLISLGIVLSVPVNAVVDHYSSDIVFNSVRVIAIVIIGLGFLLLLLPEEWDEWLIKLLTRLKVRKKEEIPEGNGDIVSGLQYKTRRTRPSMSSFTH